MQIIYTNSQNKSIVFDNKSNFIIEKTGFSHIENVIDTVQTVNHDGEKMINLRLEGRQLSVTGEAVVMGSEQLVRERLLRVFNPKLSGILTYINGNVKRSIAVTLQGSPAISAFKGATVTFAVDFKSESAYWRDGGETKTAIALWESLFEFPLELVERGLEMGRRQPSVIVNVYNKGTTATGAVIVFRARGTVVNPSLINLKTRELFELNKTMQAGETVTVNTKANQKSVKVELNGVGSNGFKFVTLESVFLQLDPGDNKLRYAAESGEESLEIDIYHYNEFVGV